MSVSLSALITGVVGVSVVHSLVPHHWLPFVLVGRRQGWDSAKTLWVLGIGAFAHTLSTIAVGLLVGFLGVAIDERYEHLHGIVPGLILLAFGAGYFLASFHHHHHEVSEKTASRSLILMLALSPCFVVAPFFVMIGPLGYKAVIQVALAMSVITVSSMTVLGWLAMRGLNVLKLEWLERNEARVMGSLLMILGISFFIH